eukprot:m.98233 g.98233  ORF g.98233 m.98233 type:complete len:87 (-) comp22089_c0_seq5:957-1217(-)
MERGNLQTRLGILKFSVTTFASCSFIVHGELHPMEHLVQLRMAVFQGNVLAPKPLIIFGLPVNPFPEQKLNSSILGIKLQEKQVDS